MKHPPQNQIKTNPERPPWWLFWVMLLLGVALAVVVRLLRERLAMPSAPAAQPPAPPPPTPAAPRPAAAVQPPAVPVEDSPAADDLTKIEGIGPKISGWLNEAGITTYAQVAELTPDQLAEILRSAGHRLAATATWPEQAAFAAAGQWEELAQFQDSLHGGRRK